MKSLRSTTSRHYAQSVCRCGSTNSPQQQPQERPFDIPFREYRRMRKQMKWRDMGVGLLGSTVSTFAFMNLFIQLYPNLFTMSPEDIKPILGMDPMIVLGLGGMSSMLISYMVFFHGFSVLWRLINPSKARALAKRDQDFMGRIEKGRFRGMTQQSWEDDYHGEKILSLSDYRQWIRKQQQKRRAAEKKN